ncbi:hypothetical protein ACFVYD_31010 [Streptomyces sp. NPDC058301]|uniref:hypothetical protein n=1 Tax=Streptomyces sp. NPDC058301 TaxID=3346436 RepID=UPI0036EF482E
MVHHVELDGADLGTGTVFLEMDAGVPVLDAVFVERSDPYFAVQVRTKPSMPIISTMSSLGLADSGQDPFPAYGQQFPPHGPCRWPVVLPGPWATNVLVAEGVKAGLKRLEQPASP